MGTSPNDSASAPNAMTGTVAPQPAAPQAQPAAQPQTPPAQPTSGDGFWAPSSIPPDAEDRQNDDAAQQPQPPAPGEQAKEGDLAGFLGMSAEQADGVVASLRAQQFAQPPQAAQAPAAPQGQPALSDDEVNAIIEDLAMGDKAAAAFRKLAKSSPGFAAAVAGQAQTQQPAQPQQQAGGVDYANPIVQAAVGAANTAFQSRLNEMGLAPQLANPAVAQAFAQTAQQIARSMNAATQPQFEQALNLALYAVLPDGVRGAYQKQGQDKVRNALERRKGLLDATQAQTTSPRGEGAPKAEDLIRAHRSGRSIRPMLGI